MKNHHGKKKKSKISRAPAHFSQEGQVVISLGGFQRVHVCTQSQHHFLSLYIIEAGGVITLLYCFLACSCAGTTWTELLELLLINTRRMLENRNHLHSAHRNKLTVHVFSDGLRERLNAAGKIPGILLDMETQLFGAVDLGLHLLLKLCGGKKHRDNYYGMSLTLKVFSFLLIWDSRWRQPREKTLTGHFGTSDEIYWDWKAITLAAITSLCHRFEGRWSLSVHSWLLLSEWWGATGEVERYINGVHEALVNTFKMTTGNTYICYEILFLELATVFPSQIILNIIK